MIVAGIDVGAKNVQIVILSGGDVAARVAVASGFDQEEAAKAGLAEAAGVAGVAVDDIDFIVATGVGRKAIPFADFLLTEVGADARGAHALLPAARTVIDVGADEARAIRVDAHGKVVDFAVNEKCAAGAGAFVEAMSRALEVGLEELRPALDRVDRVHPDERPVHGVRRVRGGQPHPLQHPTEGHRQGRARRHGGPRVGDGPARRPRGRGRHRRRVPPTTSASSRRCRTRWAWASCTCCPDPSTSARTARR